MGKPSVALCNYGFMTDAGSAASGRNIPNIRALSETIPCECNVPEQIKAGIDAILEDVINGLTKPLTEQEKSPMPKKVEELPRIVFKGNLEEVNRFFYKRGWTDGLPIIPPTEQAIAEMLTGTDLPAEHVVTKLIPRLGKATIEKIAINAVMAGALPTYMPILIAGVQALMEPKAGFGTTEVSTASWVPFWIINGPIRHSLKINSSSGALSPGDIANATIGRAMGLIIKNIGGARKGIEDMGTYGNPGKYSMVMAENEEENPWEPLNVQQGFNKTDNTLTLSFPTVLSFAGIYGSNPKAILNGIFSNVVRNGVMTIVINPQHAKALADEGWTKQEIAKYISEYGRAQVDTIKEFGRWIELKREPVFPGHTVRIIRDPDMIRIVVAGGPGATGLFVAYAGGGETITQRVTKKIELPANWDKLVNKYKDLVPSYIRY